MCSKSNSSMVIHSITPELLFEEAISHCRWTTALNTVLDTVKVRLYDDYFKDKTFEEILVSIYTLCNPVFGLGMLSVYDISAAVCRFYNMSIDKVYIIGGGPKRAIKLLGIKPKTHVINDDIKLRYVDVSDLLISLSNYGVVLDREIIKTTNGDLFESYICNWQKNI